ncbi:unnamed protein product [Arctogadus glacialis]
MPQADKSAALYQGLCNEGWVTPGTVGSLPGPDVRGGGVTPGVRVKRLGTAPLPGFALFWLEESRHSQGLCCNVESPPRVRFVEGVTPGSCVEGVTPRAVCCVCEEGVTSRVLGRGGHPQSHRALSGLYNGPNSSRLICVLVRLRWKVAHASVFRDMPYGTSPARVVLLLMLLFFSSCL